MTEDAKSRARPIQFLEDLIAGTHGWMYAKDSLVNKLKNTLVLDLWSVDSEKKYFLELASCSIKRQSRPCLWKNFNGFSRSYHGSSLK